MSDGVRQLLCTLFLSCDPFKSLLMSSSSFLPLTHKHTQTYAHLQLFQMALSHRLVEFLLPSLLNQCVCSPLCISRRRQDRSFREEMNRCRTHGPPAEPNHFSCLNIYLWASYWQHTLHAFIYYICICTIEAVSLSLQWKQEEIQGDSSETLEIWMQAFYSLDDWN